MGRSVIFAGALALAFTGPAFAQDEDLLAGSVYDGDYLVVGGGVGIGPSYDGSDDYVVFPAPIVLGSISGIGIRPRAAGLALDFVPDSAGGGVNFDAGVAARLRMNRVRQIEDEVVESLGKLDTAVEVGPTAGISVPGVLNPYDRLGFSVDARWDLAGAHGGMVVEPGISYFTPLSRAMVASLSASAEYGDGDFRDYYYAITPDQSASSGLAAFDPGGGGFNKASATLLLAYDLDGDLTNGGFGVALIGSYSRMLGDAKRSPIVADRGSANQWFGAIGVGYVF